MDLDEVEHALTKKVAMSPLTSSCWVPGASPGCSWTCGQGLCSIMNLQGEPLLPPLQVHPGYHLGQDMLLLHGAVDFGAGRGGGVDGVIMFPSEATAPKA